MAFGGGMTIGGFRASLQGQDLFQTRRTGPQPSELSKEKRDRLRFSLGVRTLPGDGQGLPGRGQGLGQEKPLLVVGFRGDREGTARSAQGDRSDHEAPIPGSISR